MLTMVSAGFKNFNQALLASFQENAEQPALVYWDNEQLSVLTYETFKDKVFQVATSFFLLGLTPGDRIVIFSNNRAEWTFTDIGGILAGGITSAIYASSTPAEVSYICNNLQARFLFVEDRELLSLVEQVREELTTVHRVVVFDAPPLPVDEEWIVPFEDFLRLSDGQVTAFTSRINELARTIAPDDPMCVILSSGTTGRPKGVILTHRNYLFTLESVIAHVGEDYIKRLHRNLSFLPLAHALERCGGQFLIFYTGKCMGFARNMETLLDDFQRIKPHLVTSVPRLFEKIYAQVQQSVAEAGWIMQKIFHWGVAVGLTISRKQEHQQPIPMYLKILRSLFQFLVYKKFQEFFGGELVLFFSGGAPLNPEIARFFHAMGVLILEGWGATEATAPATLNQPHNFRFGSVGKPLPGVTIKLAEDGELLIKGENVFKGYWNLPEETQSAFTEDGFYRTGDIGRIDEDGFVYIVDRKKEIIITAGGKNIPPAPIEQLLTQSPLIDQALVHGDRRKFVSALVVLNKEELYRLASKLNIPQIDKILLKHPVIQEYVQFEIDTVNARLPRFMQIKKFRMLLEPFTVENGELTPTLKLKRRVIEEKYCDLLESMYRE